MEIPNVKITIWYACTEDARGFAKRNAIGGWRITPAGQRVFIEPPAQITREDWDEFGRMIGVKQG